MKERSIDSLAPQALALIFGLAALSAAVAALVADFSMGRPSSSSALGIVFMFPVALLAAVLGFAIGHVIGILLRKWNVTPAVPLKPYRFVMALVLLAVMAAGAAAGARPVLKREGMHFPRVLVGADVMQKSDGRPDNCTQITPAVVACDLGTRQTSYSLAWNGRDVTIGCTREGRITLSDASSGVITSIDLSAYEYVRQVRVAGARQTDGREALAMLAALRARGDREMFLVIDADGRSVYQELLERSVSEPHTPLSVCSSEDLDSVVIDLGSPVTYRGR